MFENFGEKIDEIECIKEQLEYLKHDYNMYRERTMEAEARLQAIKKINDGKNAAIDALCESDFRCCYKI